MHETIKTIPLCRLEGARLARATALKKQLEAPHDRIVYGQARRVEPTFCDVVIGDGAHLLVVTAVQTVPAYHLVLIDSSWVRHVAPSFRTPHGMEADLEDHPERRDMIAEVLLGACGDGDLWHEEHGDDAIAPQGYFHAEMGFYWGVEALGPDGLLPKEDARELEPAE